MQYKNARCRCNTIIRVNAIKWLGVIAIQYKMLEINAIQNARYRTKCSSENVHSEFEVCLHTFHHSSGGFGVGN